VLHVGRISIIALVGGLAQAVRARASRPPQGILFSNLNTYFRTHKDRLNENTGHDSRACFLFAFFLVPAAGLISTQRQWHFLGDIDANIQDSTRCSGLPTDDQCLSPPEPTCELQVLALSKVRRPEEGPSICFNAAQ
jgi:hypothetical protein